MTVAQVLSDLDEVVQLAKHCFNKNKVVLLGHSWGTVLGTRYPYRAPENVAAYVGIAQILPRLDLVTCRKFGRLRLGDG